MIFLSLSLMIALSYGRGFGVASARQGLGELVQTAFPQLPVLAYPRIDISERLRPERVEALLSVGPHLHEPRLLEDAEVPRYARLVDIDVADNLVDRALAAAQDFDYT